MKISKILALSTIALHCFSLLPGIQNNAFFNHNTGTSISTNIAINANHYTNNGKIYGAFGANIKAKTIDGSGTISSDQITIECDEFAYTGTINCNGTCTIYAKKAFAPKQFKKQGSGTFTAIISPYDRQAHTKETLLSYASKMLIDSCIATEKENKTVTTIKEMRAHAALNNIDEKECIPELQSKLEKAIAYRQEHINETRDLTALGFGLVGTGISAAGFALAYACYKNDQAVTNWARKYVQTEDYFGLGISAAIGFLSALPLVVSAALFGEGLNPQHKEKHAALTAIEKKVAAEFAKPRVAEEQIITL